MARQSEPDPRLSGLGNYLKANKGLAILLVLAAVALGVYWRQHLTGTKALVYQLRRAGASVDEVQGGSGQYDVNFNGARIGDKEVRLLLRLGGVRSLDLSQTPVTDAELKQLAGLSSLTDLHLNGTRVSAKGLEELPRLSRLRRLSLGRCAVGDDELALLAKCPALEHLDLHGTRIGDTGLARLVGFPRLAVINLSGTKVSDAGMPELARVPRLIEVDLSATALSNAGLQALRSAGGLQGLTLGATRVNDAGLRHLEGLAQLRKLGVGMLPISDAGLRHLAGLSRLEELDLHHTRISDAGLTHLLRLPLRKLLLSSTSVSDDGMATVARLVGLQHLEIEGAANTLPAEMDRPERLAQFFRPGGIGGPSITDDGLQHLARLGGLRVLRLGGSAITDEGLASLAGLRDLQDLSLWGTQIGDEGLRHLTGLTRLHRLELGGTSLAGQGLAELKGLTSLRILGLGGTNVSDEHVVHLRPLTGLVRLDLGGTGIGDEALAVLGQLTRLETLDLGGTRITDEGLAHLQALKRLRRLTLVETKIGDAGLAHLEQLPALEEVYASQTAITAGAAQAFLDKAPPVRVQGVRKLEPPPPDPQVPAWEEETGEGKDVHGDPLPRGARVRLGTVRLCCPAGCAALALTPDGRTLIASGRDGRVRLWDTRDGRLLHVLGARGARSGVVALAPKGELLATVGEDGAIQLWNPATGRHVRELPGPRTPSGLAFAPDGKSLAVVSYPSDLQVLDVTTGKQLLALRGRGRMRSTQGPNEHFGAVAFAPDGKTLAIGSQQSTRRAAWRVIGGKRRLLWLGSEKGSIRVWDWPTGKPLARLEGVRHAFGSFAYTYGGKRLLGMARDGSLLLWDARTGRPLRRLATGQRQGPGGLVVAPDGKSVLLWQGTAWERWDLSRGRPAGRLKVSGWPLTFSADGTVAATARGEGPLALWDPATGQERVPLERHAGLSYPRPIAYSPDGRTLATAGQDQSIRLWERSTGKPLRKIDVPERQPSWVSFSPDGRLLAAGLFPGPRRGTAGVRVWEAQTGRVVFETPAEGWADGTPVSPALGPDGLLAVGRNPLPAQAGSVILLIDTRTGQKRQMDAGGPVDHLALSADGRRLAWGGRGREVSVADVSTARVVRRLSLPKLSMNELYRMIFHLSPDGRRLAVGLGTKGTLLVDCTGEGAARTVPPPAGYAPEALRFDRGGRLLAAGHVGVPVRSGSAADVLVWDVLTGKPVRPPWRTTEVGNLTLAPDGTELATTRAGGEVLLWGPGGRGEGKP